MTRPIQLSAESVEHYTPSEYTEAARYVMGSIDLDPASCELANRSVRASRYYSEHGLELPWFGNVFLNPPGGYADKAYGARTNSAALWWATLVLRWTKGYLRQGVYVMFNLETLRHAQKYDVAHPLDFQMCFPRDRISYLCPDGGGGIEIGENPAHPSALVYLPPRMGQEAHCKAFRETFSAFGKVTHCDLEIPF